ncbi:MAG: RHS repeat-associated core domain-containing protein [Chloroflexi bacterium]|nr:RHS repeat-associated core domain-containing protein [Chloroflexota bacterium]
MTLVKGYQPYGDVLSSAGSGVSSYGFTGEWSDSTGLIHLRARYLDVGMGRFTQKDPSELESNLYLYAGANPINRIDPSGLVSVSSLTGPAAFSMCFNLHSLGKGWLLRNIDALDAIEICKKGFDQNSWNRSWFNFNGDLPTTGQDLFGWYLFEHGDDHLVFNGPEFLNYDLASSKLLDNKRIGYYTSGGTDKPVEYEFYNNEQAQCFMDFAHMLNPNSVIPVTCVLGSFYYQIKTLDMGEYVGFRIDNRTDLSSGSHYAGHFPKKYENSVEGLFERGEITGLESLYSLYKDERLGLLSILKPRTRGQTQVYRDVTGFQLGGGIMDQTYVWKEKRDSCRYSRFDFLYSDIEIEPWYDYKAYTDPVYGH